MSTQLENETVTTTKSMPFWNVILLNTDTHTFNFVIQLIMEVFNKDFDEAKECTLKIHKDGQCIVETTHKERAEMLQDKVQTYGADPEMKGRRYPLPCVIEPQT